MKLTNCKFFVCVFLFMLSLATSSHFRGALITWKPLATYPGPQYEMEVSIRIAWRRSYDSRTHCDDNTIAQGVEIGTGTLECRSGCSGTLIPMHYNCTDYSLTEDWSGGVGMYRVNVTTPVLEASYAGIAWISLESGGNDWEVRVRVDLTTRADTGRINTSPTSAISPIVRLQYGCSHTIVIPVEDVDGDYVRCRWAIFSRSECGGVCGTFTGATINEDRCEIYYNAVGSTGWYAVALQIEDFANQSSTVALSSVPAQFLVNVFDSSMDCAAAPEFVSPTRSGGSCVAVPFNTTFMEQIVATTSNASISIVAINTVSPFGLRKSAVQKSNNSDIEYYITVTWSPEESQNGPNIFCFTAVDSVGLSSQQRCITLLGGVEAPAAIPASRTPIGEVWSNQSEWMVTFDKSIVRPSSSHFIRFFSDDGNQVLAYDSSSSPNVVFLDTELGTTLRIMTEYTFTEGSSYYIILDAGVAIELVQSCSNGVYSKEESATDFWTFAIRDITPPRLMFTLAPFYSNGTITISWVFNERTSVICTLQTPEDLLITSCVGDLFFMSGLNGGIYTLFIQGTDNAGNVANIVTHTWEVDVEAPIAVFTSTPDPVSNTDSWDFTFECTNEISCTFLCSVQLVGDQSNFVDCYGSFAVSGLVDGGNYVIYVTPIDEVGNIGNTIDYQWSIDLIPPTITPLSNVGFTCGDPYSPEQAGTPMATDDDSTPTLSYEDSPEVGCSLSRLWIARDDAGNEATTVQIITFISPSPPSIFAPIIVTIPCASVKDAIENAEMLQNQLQVSHPCDRPVVITYQDSANLDRCSFTFTRTWFADDDCGNRGTFQQNIQVLNQVFPDYPENDEVNVEVDDPLRWPQHPGATSYEIYLWTDGTEKPTEPIAIVEGLVYYPSGGFTPGTRYIWQINYILANGSVIPSPNWEFEVQSYLDFNVASITLPAYAFSGQNFEVTWVITNIGNLSTGGRFWTDSVYMSADSDFQNSRRVNSIRQERFIDPDDGYTSQVTVNLEDDNIGFFYVFVLTDTYNQLSDFDRMNNLKVSSRPLEVKLSPPPNLIVENIIVPSSSFSGEEISVRWTVTNTGFGITATDLWHDRIYWSSDNILDKDDLMLTNIEVDGFLAVGSSYTKSATIMIPRAIFGNFSIIVVTDALEMVYEHTRENDNAKPTEDPITVTLTPPPDLSVTDISTANTLVTGDEMVVQYTVTNIGAGAPFEPYWRDQIKFGEKVICSLLIYENLGLEESYTRECKYVIPTAFQSGLINLNITIDYNNQVFEYLSEENNFESRSIQILQSLADLIVDKVATTLVSSYEGNYILVNYSVINNGTGPTINAPWREIIGLSYSITYTKKDILADSRRVMSANLGHGQLVNRRNIRIDVPEYITSTVFIHIFVDTENRIEEWNEDNNIRTSEPVDIPLVAADLAVLELTYMPELRQYSGSEVTVTWTVTNKGNRSLENKRWFDSVLFSSSSNISDSFINSRNVPISYTLVPGSNYTQSQVVHIPDGLNGTYFLHIKVDSQSDVFEDGLNDNNALSVPVNILIPPSPDFIVKSVSGNVFVTEGKTRILLVNGIILNHGNSLLFEAFWVDEIYITDQLPFSKDSAVKLDEVMNTGYLESFQEYTIVRNIIIPDTVTGSFYVAIVVDAANNIVEVLGEENNYGHSDETIYIRPPLLPILAVNILFDKLPSRAIARETFPLFYDITNKGEKDLPTSSFTSEIYLIPEVSGSRRQVNGIFLRQIIHTLSLSVNETQSLSTNITIPYDVNQLVFLVVALDVKNVLSLGNTDNGVTQTKEAILVEDGPLANLLIRIDTSSSKLNLTSGQPANISYEVINNGASATLGDWYETISLSRDNSLDAFDIKLKTVLRLMELEINESYSQIIEVFIPYSIPTEDYYLFFSVDTLNHIPEISESDNHVSRLVSIKETVSTDIAVQDVFATPENLTYNEDVFSTWKLVNKGQILAEGYKCDTLYLSEDEKWDITDYQIGDPLCSAISIEPFDNVSMAAVSFSLEARVPDDIVPNTYKALIRTRSNIRDPILDNNVATSVLPLKIMSPSLDLDNVTRITLKLGEELTFRIDNIPAGETLIATLVSIGSNSFFDLFLKFNQPPTASDHDAYSQYAFSTNQTVILTNTKNGTYYLKIESLADMGVDEQEVEVLLRIASFEIFEINPKRASPLGRVTIHFFGSVFGYDLTAFIIDPINHTYITEATRVYRFSSTEVYVTFDITGIPFGTYSVQLRNLGTNDTAELSDSLTIFDGIPGQSSIDMSAPDSLRAGDNGTVTIIVKNTGNTDILTPCLSLQTTSEVVFHMLNERTSSVLNILAVPSIGPGGILPPGASAKLNVEISPTILNNFIGDAELFEIPDTNENHTYYHLKDILQPENVPDDIWEVIWSNFLDAVGTTWSSLKNQMSEIANEFSLVDLRIHSIDKLLYYQMQVADGLFTGREILNFADITEDRPSSSLFLTVQRKYSSYISKRRTVGPVGKGWLLPWWELHIDVIRNGTIEYIILNDERAQTTYVVTGTDTYSADDGNTIYLDRATNVLTMFDNASNIKYTFDYPRGLLVKIQSLTDNSSLGLTYNEGHQPSKFKHSSGKAMNVAYTETGLISYVDILDENGDIQHTSTYSYDPTDQLLTTVAANDKSTHYEYNEFGDLISIKFASGRKRCFIYDSHHILTRNEFYHTSNSLLQSTEISYLWWGKVHLTLQPQNRTSEITYDPSGNVVAAKIGNNLPIREVGYGLERKFIYYGDEVALDSTYDLQSNTVFKVDANGGMTAMKFGPNGEVIKFTDAGGFVYQSTFDSLGRRNQTVYPDGSTEIYSYDSLGNVNSVTRQDGRRIIFSYDDANNLIQKSLQEVTIGFQYDRFQQLIGANIHNENSQTGEFSIRYDQNGVPIEVAYPNGHSLFYGYNSKYQRVYLADNRGYNITYEYDNNDRLSVIRNRTTDVILAQWEYEESIYPIRKTLGNGAYTLFKYDKDTNNLLEIKNFFPNGTLSSMFLYEYNRKGRIVSIETIEGTWTYDYDAAEQLTQWRSPDGDKIEIQYDKRGNRIVQRKNGVEQSYTVNNLNQILRYGESEAFSYDGNGNRNSFASPSNSSYYVFNEEGKLTEYTSSNLSCSYEYDPLGNLYKKSCSDSTFSVYLVDPFGLFGADVIAEESNGELNYYVNSLEQGLVAILKSNSQVYYYEFDGDGSVVRVMDPVGKIQNFYKYDPFGNILEQSEDFFSTFAYVGRLGVIRHKELQNLYHMRARFYDAQHGCFISLDPLGFAGRTDNFYQYAYNNPLSVKDPTGELLPYFVFKVGKGAATSSFKYVITSTISGDFSLSGLAGAVASGAVGGVFDLIPGRGVVKQIARSLAESGAGNVAESASDDTKEFSFRDVFVDASKSSITSGAFNRIKGAWDLPDNLILDALLNNKIRKVVDMLGGVLKDFKDDLKQLVKLFTAWIGSFDPNDILGPPGFGPEHFVPPTQVFEYTIRFENDPNATAPAQRVLIRHQLDDDLDIRTFRVGSFGFGDFVNELTYSSSFLQVNLDLTATLGHFVRVRCGVDIVRRLATWELQSLDPETGEAPVDPSIGFLPPNNGTTGQGFVKFLVKPIDMACCITRIDAEATIIFDQNEPIGTPPIFNTIDAVGPEINFTIIENLLDVGILALVLEPTDTGSGVKKGDIYLSDAGIMKPLLLDVTDSLVVLPLQSGATYNISVTVTDNVGNRGPDTTNRLTIDFPFVNICPNNCSENGDCTAIGTCRCETGFYGNDCSLDQPPAEPPILESLLPITGAEDEPVILRLSAGLIIKYDRDDIEINLKGFPEGTNFSKGRLNKDIWIFKEYEFGEIKMYLPKYFSGSFELNVSAVNLFTNTSTSSTINILIIPVANPPYLLVKDTCFDGIGNGSFNINIESYAVDKSEILSVFIRELPEPFMVLGSSRDDLGNFKLSIDNLPDVKISFNTTFKKIMFVVVAVSSLNGSYGSATTIQPVQVDHCSKLIPVANPPYLLVKDTCFDGIGNGSFNINIESYTVDKSEILSVFIRDLPEPFMVLGSSRDDLGNFQLSIDNLPDVKISFNATFNKTMFVVVAVSSLNGSYGSATTIQPVQVDYCSILCSDPQSSTIFTSTVIVAIIGAISGLIALGFISLITCLLVACCKRSVKYRSSYTTRAKVFYNVSSKAEEIEANTIATTQI